MYIHNILFHFDDLFLFLVICYKDTYGYQHSQNDQHQKRRALKQFNYEKLLFHG